jgi:HKD family nuclease
VKSNLTETVPGPGIRRGVILIGSSVLTPGLIKTSYEWVIKFSNKTTGGLSSEAKQLMEQANRIIKQKEQESSLMR